MLLQCIRVAAEPVLRLVQQSRVAARIKQPCCLLCVAGAVRQTCCLLYVDAGASAFAAVCLLLLVQQSRVAACHVLLLVKQSKLAAWHMLSLVQ